MKFLFVFCFGNTINAFLIKIKKKFCSFERFNWNIKRFFCGIAVRVEYLISIHFYFFICYFFDSISMSNINNSFYSYIITYLYISFDGQIVVEFDGLLLLVFATADDTII